QPHRAQRDDQADAAARQADPGQQGGQQRQVDGHRQVLHDEDAEDDGGLAVAEPAQVGEDLGDDAGGGDPGDTGQGHGGHRTPAHDQGRDGSGGGVEDEVHQPGRVLRLEVVDEFRGAVLQAQQEQQQD